MDLLLLSDSDVRAGLVMNEAIGAVEDAFRDLAEGRANMPSKLYLQFPRFEGDLRVMPASLGDKFAGVKIVNVHAKNPQRKLPSVMGTYVLVSQETGAPLAVLSATWMTAMRTGAASAVATKYMARRNASVLGLVGSGVQARFQLEAIAEVAELAEVRVWGPASDRERVDLFVADMRARHPGIELRPVSRVEEAAGADIVCTTTPSRVPIVPDEAIGPGTHVNAVGADGPGKQELDPRILKRARLIVDEREQSMHGGEINVPLEKGEIDESDISGSLPEVITGRVPGRTSEDEVTVFDSTGLAIQDIALASVVYERAVKEGLGTKLEFL